MDKRGLISWILYDFGMAQFSMVILTAYFILYFKQIVVGDIRGDGDFLWGLATSSSMALTVLLSPILGTYSDISGNRKTLYILFSLISIISTFLLYFSDRGTIFYSTLFFVVAYACYAINMTFYNSFLPDIVKRDEIEKYSGIGWGAGYFGGLLSLIIMALIVKEVESSKIIIIITALSYLLFALPSFLYLPKQTGIDNKSTNILHGFIEIKNTFNNIRCYRNIFIFLFSYFFISDGISTVIVFFSSYTVHTLKFSLSENFGLLMIIQISAAMGAMVSGFIAKRIGLIKTIIFTIIIWIISIGVIYIVSSKIIFFIVSSICGSVLGATQSLARSYIATTSPKEKSGEFFGFMTFSSKIAAIFGPLLFGIVSKTTNSQRLSILSLELLFIIGLIILFNVKDQSAKH
ncbi:MAG: MFS transporter [Deltaproteobacteria bacterium]|nr:MFS transporter [Deltaproteobacteria bacterium]